MDWIEVNGVSLRYELAGSGSTTLVLVHEAGGAIESWDETLPALQRHFRTLRYDQRGFGQSEKLPGPLTIDDMVADLVGLLQALGIDRPCHVAGSAMGAGIAAAFTARHPARVARLVVQSLVTRANESFRQSMLERAAAIERDGMRAHAEASLQRSYAEALRGDRPRYERYRLRWIGNDPQSYAAINRMGLGLQLDAEIERIACPTLVIGCRHDPLRPPAMVQALAERMPNARYVEAESGHFMHVQTPQRFTELALPFLLE
jgi:3-oxoadipate enol-lactonase